MTRIIIIRAGAVTVGVPVTRVIRLKALAAWQGRAHQS